MIAAASAETAPTMPPRRRKESRSSSFLHEGAGSGCGGSSRLCQALPVLFQERFGMIREQSRKRGNAPAAVINVGQAVATRARESGKRIAAGPMNLLVAVAYFLTHETEGIVRRWRRVWLSWLRSAPTRPTGVEPGATRNFGSTAILPRPNPGRPARGDIFIRFFLAGPIPWFPRPDTPYRRPPPIPNEWWHSGIRPAPKTRSWRRPVVAPHQPERA
jgi:hypothetical protein